MITKAFSFYFKIIFFISNIIRIFTVSNYNHMNVLLTMPPIIDEKLTQLPKETVIKRQTKRIAQHFNMPIVSTIFGSYMNTYCHIQDAYTVAQYNTLLNAKN